MTTLGVISDLHLAPRGMSRCTASEDELLALLDTMLNRVDRVVVAGDLFDLSRPVFPWGWRAWLDEIRLAYPRFVGRIERHERVYGNHDIWLRNLGVPETILVDLDGWNVRIQHGHQFDVPMKQIRPLEAAGNYVAGWMVRANLDGVAKAIGQVPIAVDSVRHPSDYGADRGAAGARKLLNAGADVVVMGHSHRLRVVQEAAGLFVNTGSLCCGHIDWAQIDGADRTITLFRDGERFERYDTP